MLKIMIANAAIICMLAGCGGGGSGESDSRNSNDSSSNDNNNSSNGELDITVTGLVTELDVIWAGQTITMSHDRLEAHLEATGNDIAPPKFTSPEFQRCNREMNGRDGKYTLVIHCQSADEFILSVNITNLRGPLDLQWAGQTERYDESNRLTRLSARPGKVVEPLIVAAPLLQDCAGEFSYEGRLLQYDITCIDHTAVNHINIDQPLAFPVTLTTRNNASVVLQEGDESFAIEASRLDDVEISNVGGSQLCSLEKGAFTSNPDTQQWALSCEEFLVYSDTRAESAGVYLSFKSKNPIALHLGEVDGRVVHAQSKINQHLILHPALGGYTIDVSLPNLEWEKHGDETSFDQILMTHDSAYAVTSPLNERKSIRRYDSEFINTRVLSPGRNPYSLSLLTVSPKTNTIGIDIFFDFVGEEDKNRSIFIKQDRAEVRLVFSVASARYNVPYLVQSGPRFFSFYQANNITSKLESHIYFRNSAYSGAVNVTDMQANIATWYDANGDERVLLLAKGLGGAKPTEMRLAELQSSSNSFVGWTLIVEPLGLETFVDKPSYMGTDMQANTLVLAGDALLGGDELVAIVTANGQSDIAALKSKIDNTAMLRVQPSVIGSKGGIEQRKVHLHNGWMLLFAGPDESGDVWLTNGEVNNTHLVEEQVTWSDFSHAGVYQITAAGADMVAVNYVKGEVAKHKLFR